LAITLSSLGAPRTDATTLLPLSFEEVTATAQHIIRGVVDEIVAKEERGDIVTYVTLRDVRVVGGEPLDSSTYTLRLAGGVLKHKRVTYIGMPEFRSKDEVVLFIHKNGTALAPIVGWTHGYFRVTREAGRDVVRDYDGHRIVVKDESVALIRSVSRQAPEDPQPGALGRAESPSAAWTVDDFESFVTSVRGRSGYRPDPPRRRGLVSVPMLREVVPSQEQGAGDEGEE
jgi:hypothetical protein